MGEKNGALVQQTRLLEGEVAQLKSQVKEREAEIEKLDLKNAGLLGEVGRSQRELEARGEERLAKMEIIEENQKIISELKNNLRK